jgi:hypothetical protein
MIVTNRETKDYFFHRRAPKIYRRRKMSVSMSFMSFGRKWGGLILVCAGIAGLFMVNSMLIYDRLNQIDDEVVARRDEWAGSSLSLSMSSNSIKRHLAAIDSLSHRSAATTRHTPKERQLSHATVDKENSIEKHIRRRADKRGPTTRQLFEQDHSPSDTQRIHDFIDSLRDHDFDKRQQRADLSYDIYNCPEDPPPGYPMAWKVLDVLNHWNVDETAVPSTPVYQGLCVFDWNTEQEKATNYRAKEQPFIVRNHPGVMASAERWNTPGYLDKLLGSKPQRSEHGTTNHLMFWRTIAPDQQHLVPKDATFPPGWTPPTDFVNLTYQEWLEKAQNLEENSKGTSQAQKEHFYFRINAFQGLNRFLYDEMPFFDPIRHKEFMANQDPNAFLTVDASEHRGINCRFGQKGLVAEMHFDSTRNFVVLLGGLRRYILAHPNQCKNFDLFDRLHPSGRHSKVNWSDLSSSQNTSGNDQESPLASAMVNEVVMQAGDMM